MYRNIGLFIYIFNVCLHSRFVYLHFSVFIYILSLFIYISNVYLQEFFEIFKLWRQNFDLFTNSGLFIYIFSVCLHSRFVYLHFQCLFTFSVCLFTFSMFIYILGLFIYISNVYLHKILENFRKFEILALKFRFV